jgi:uncharacterized membrane protein
MKFTSRIVLAALFVVAGTLHFLIPAVYLRIMPPYLAAKFSIAHRMVSVPLLLIWISGVAEIAGGVGLLIPATRNAAAWGLVALLIAVFPANLYMAQAHLPFPGIAGQGWAQWARLPMQAVLIWWVLSTRRA